MKYKNIKHLNRGIIVELIKTIWVHENGEITIDFNFSDEYEGTTDHIENVRSTYGKAGNRRI